MAAELQLELSKAEALVLFEMLARFQEADALSLEHAAEFVALSRLAGLLEKALVEPFSENYPELLERARAELAEGFEGVAPGIPSGGP